MTTKEEKYIAVSTAFTHNYGFDIRGLYCQITGKQIGQLYSADIMRLIDSSTDDAEGIADDLALRLCSSMRPSLKWNKFNDSTLAGLAKDDYVEVIAYMLNRMFYPLQGEFDSYMRNIPARIKCYDLLHKQNYKFNRQAGAVPRESMEAPEPNPLKTILHHLLQVDALVPANHLFNLKVTLDWNKPLGEQVIPICLSIVDYVRQQEKKANWIRGNPLAAKAYYSTFMHKPAESKTAKKKETKRKSDAFLDNTLAALMQGEGESNPTSTLAKPKLAKMPKKFGVKS